MNPNSFFLSFLLLSCLLQCFGNWPIYDMHHCENAYIIPYPYHQSCFNRNEITEIVNELNFTRGVEVGVQKGHHSAATLRFWSKAEKYYMVDLWANQENYADSANVDQTEQNSNYEQAKHNVAEFGDVPELIKNYSVLAALQIKDDSLDYIYLDARHDYCGVMEDLNAWWPKLKVGGMLAGHDFLYASEALSMSKGVQVWNLCGNGTIHEGGVKGAVEEFACKHKVMIFHDRSKPPSFYFSPKRAGFD